MQTRKSNLCIGAAIIFLLYGVNLLCVLIGQSAAAGGMVRNIGFNSSDPLRFTTVIVMALCSLGLAICFFNKKRSHALTALFGVMAGACLLDLIQVFVQLDKYGFDIGNSEVIKYYLPQVFELIGAIFAVIACAGGVKLREGARVSGAALLWPIAGCCFFAMALTYYIVNFEIVKYYFEALEYVNRISDAGVLFLYFSLLIYLIMMLVLPFGFFFGNRWIVAPVKAVVPFAGQPYANGFAAPQYAQPQYTAPQYDPQQYAAPQYAQPQYAAPQYDPQQYIAPQYAQPQYTAPQYDPQQYAAPQYAQPQYAAPQYDPQQYAAPQCAQPQYPTEDAVKADDPSVESKQE